jgi:hypothetical protein
MRNWWLWLGESFGLNDPSHLRGWTLGAPTMSSSVRKDYLGVDAEARLVTAATNTVPSQPLTSATYSHPTVTLRQ